MSVVPTGGTLGWNPLLLAGDAFGDEYPALRRALPDWLDRLIGWRIVPGTRFLRAVESDHHDSLWRFALEESGSCRPERDKCD